MMMFTLFCTAGWEDEELLDNITEDDMLGLEIPRGKARDISTKLHARRAQKRPRIAVEHSSPVLSSIPALSGQSIQDGSVTLQRPVARPSIKAKGALENRVPLCQVDSGSPPNQITDALVHANSHRSSVAFSSSDQASHCCAVMY